MFGFGLSGILTGLLNGGSRKLNADDRTKEGFVLWFTGLPCSGKTTVAEEVSKALKDRGRKIECLDGDVVRKSLSADLGFSKQDREENLNRVIFICRLLSRNGVGVLASFVSPYRKIRRKAREETTNFIEVFASCPLAECRKRDVKGMYKSAEEGRINNFTGISAPYETPESPEIIIPTDRETSNRSCARIIGYLEENKFL